MRLLILFLLVSCAHRRQTPEEDLVSLDAALNQAQASYLKGCVDAMKKLKIPIAFPGCLDMAKIHRVELNQLMQQEITNK